MTVLASKVAWIPSPPWVTPLSPLAAAVWDGRTQTRARLVGATCIPVTRRSGPEPLPSPRPLTSQAHALSPSGTLPRIPVSAPTWGEPTEHAHNSGNTRVSGGHSPVKTLCHGNQKVKINLLLAAAPQPHPNRQGFMEALNKLLMEGWGAGLGPAAPGQKPTRVGRLQVTWARPRPPRLRSVNRTS